MQLSKKDENESGVKTQISLVQDDNPSTYT
jgi:hypothetical protein